MKKFGVLLVLALVVLTILPAPVAKAASAGVCLRCGSTDTYWAYSNKEITPFGNHCYKLEKQKQFNCVNCGYVGDWVDNGSIVGPYHSCIYTDMGCYLNVHTWRKDCKNCSFSLIVRVACPGPPHCVQPY